MLDYNLGLLVFIGYDAVTIRIFGYNLQPTKCYFARMLFNGNQNYFYILIQFWTYCGRGYQNIFTAYTDFHCQNNNIFRPYSAQKVNSCIEHSKDEINSCPDFLLSLSRAWPANWAYGMQPVIEPLSGPNELHGIW